MKNLFTLLFAVALSAQSAFGQAQRLVFAEEFTQASCGPCASQNPAFNALLANNTTKIVALKYQTSWPGYDPMNEQNPDEVQARVTYYGVNGVPNAIVDGVVVPNTCAAYLGAPACLKQADIDARYAVTSPIEMTTTHTFSVDYKKVTITVDVKNVSADPVGGAGFNLFVALAENEINFATPPGSNGEAEFYGVMRKMYPGAGGTAMPAPIAAGDTWSQSWTVDLPTYLYNLAEIEIISFVQEVATKNVLQASLSKKQTGILAILPDAGAADNTTAPSSLCEYEIVPVAQLQNDGGVTITSATVSLSLDGSFVATKDWTGSLATGQTADVTFAAQTLGGGNHAYYYQVGNINNGMVDYNKLNNETATVSFALLSPTAFSTKIEEGMESTDNEALPVNTISDGSAAGLVFTIDKSFFSFLTTPPTKPAGGFAASDKSLCVYLWAIPAGDEAGIVWDKIDLSNALGSKLFFDRAYRQYTAGSPEQDQLLVEASTDCGANWTTLWDKKGNDLKTAAASTTNFCPQTVAQWRKDSVDLASVVGQSEVVIRFRVVSDFGNNLFLDNINVVNQTVAVNDPVLEKATSIFPNPASDVVNVELNLPEAMNLTVKITDVAGREISRLADNEVVSAGKSTFKFDQFKSSGTYFVTILSADGQSTKRFTVLK